MPKSKRSDADQILKGVDSDAKCNPVDSIGSSTKSRVSHSERRPSARFPGAKTARRGGISSPFSDAGGGTSPQNSGGKMCRGLSEVYGSKTTARDRYCVLLGLVL